MTEFEHQVVTGLAEVRAAVRAVGERVGALTDRFEQSEAARQKAQVEHAERFGRIEARMGTNGMNGATRPALHVVVAHDDRAEAEEYRSLRRIVGRAARSWVLWVVLGLLGGGSALGVGLRCHDPEEFITRGAR